MSKLLFLFLDGVGLGEANPETNPFVQASMPHLEKLLGGQKLIETTAPFQGEEASLTSLNPRMGVPGTPQSATGQAAILTGHNVPKIIGQHYGPKPNQSVSQVIQQDNIFLQVKRRGGSAALLNAYPPRYFEAIESGRRLYSSIPLAYTTAGFELMSATDYQQGRSISADFTGEGWAEQPSFPPGPIYHEEEAGERIVQLTLRYDLTWFDYWLTDYAGHRATMERAVELLQTFDAVLGGIVRAWQGRPDLIMVTSDHGNLEDLKVKGHTLNDVPLLLIGPEELRDPYMDQAQALSDLAPLMIHTMFPASDER